MTFDPDEDVPEGAVSSLSKEITKRNLHLRDICKVKSLSVFQKISAAPPAELLPGLTLSNSPDTEFRGIKSAGNYVLQLRLHD